jgi:hypothetical protein
VKTILPCNKTVTLNVLQPCLYKVQKRFLILGQGGEGAIRIVIENWVAKTKRLRNPYTFSPDNQLISFSKKVPTSEASLDQCHPVCST